MANEQNLKPSEYKLSQEEAKKGGINSGKSRREKRDLREMMKLWLDTEVGKDKNGDPLTGAELMVAVAAKEMKNGSPKFWELIRDTAGFKPVEKVMISEVDQDIIDEVEKAVLNEEKTNNAEDNEA